ncbi:ABC transporter substrate-binding protein [Telmatospirillum sp. J64-1]|uniref:ABC transporter substrate-binding protein n=1 Tax=Telmatospirillum sp. J64-1 TaxID=2502183 RepID=UPI001C8F8528|nr:ABC transporter substrate-binding protein [Telmatospirillum sp. J64-1]
MLKMFSRPLLASAAAFGLLALSTAAQASSITVYSALEEDEIAEYLAAARKSLPDIQIDVLRLSTGDLGARLIAEAGNPRADVIWGLAVTNILDPSIKQMLEEVEIPGVETLPEPYRAEDGSWFAATGYLGAFCVNTAVLEAKNLPKPTSWEDLTDPVYKGEIVMPNPASSGTGYLQIAAILQGMGEEKGWDLLERLDQNIAQYPPSGSRPCTMARSGEYAIGASLSFVAMKSIEAGFPVEMVIPADLAGYELEASGLVKGSKNREAALRFLEWTVSPEAAEVYSKYKDMITIPGVPRSEMADKAGLPENLTEVLYPMDFAKSAVERPEILAKWRSTINR